MIARLSDELVLELERHGDGPLRVENPHNHKLYVIVPEEQLPIASQTSAVPTNGEWSEAKNARRFELIDREIAGGITSSEVAELNRLQQEIDLFLQRVSPLPINAARELHEQLLRSLKRDNSP